MIVVSLLVLVIWLLYIGNVDVLLYFLVSLEMWCIVYDVF